MKILFISTWFPYPPVNGSKIRVFNLLKALGKQHQIDLISFTRKGQLVDPSGLDNICNRIQTLPWKEFSPRNIRANIGFLSPLPRSVFDTFSQDMRALLHDQLAENGYQALVASQLGTAVYIPRDLETPCVFDEVELGIYRDAWLTSNDQIKKSRRWLTWAKQKHFTRNLLSKFQACTVVSDQEKSILNTILPDYPHIHVIPNGVDLDEMPLNLTSHQKDTLVYTGSLTYGANYDAMCFFLEKIFPIIQDQIPGIKLKITGSNEDVNLNALPQNKNVILTGFLQDIRKTILEAWALVVPLRIGGGTRLKILEAMALGTPVISTSKGAEGLDVTPEENILLADEPEEFAAQTVRLLKRPDLRKQLASQGRRLVEKKYDWNSIGSLFVKMIENKAKITALKE